MRQAGPRRSFSGWIAIFAIFWAALAPTISHALADRGLPAEICSAAGSTAIGAVDDASPQPSGAKAFEHCPYCSLQAHGFALPVTPLRLPPPPALVAPLPVDFGPVALPRLRWSSAPPRAPPFVS